MLSKLSHSVKSWSLFKGMSDSEIQRVLNHSDKQSFKSGEILCKQGDDSECMYVILSGRVQVQVQKKGGYLHNLNVLGQGDHFGELSLLTGSPRMATVTTIMDTSVVKISHSRFKQLIHDIPAFSVNLSHTIGHWLKGALSGKSSNHKLGIVAFVQTTPSSVHLSKQISDWLVNQGKKITVLTDCFDDWKHLQNPSLKLQSVSSNLTELQETINSLGLTSASNTTHTQSNKDPQVNSNECDHVIIDILLALNEDTQVLAKLLNQCERIWYVLNQTNASNSHNGTEVDSSFNSFISNQKSLSDKTQVIHLRSADSHSTFVNHQQIDSEHKKLHCEYEPETLKVRCADLSRIHHLIVGVQIGIALGGGGARSLAHIGVLAALKDNHIYFDRMAGTSGGAIISSFYASGYDLQNILELFDNEMSPPKWMRYIPYATRWHLMSLFRFKLLEERFRKYLKDHSLEQLLIPTHLVSADLISGNEIIRSDGNIIDAILESINHPLLGRPIYRDGLSLVDGGVLNNVPSSVLRQHKSDYVVSVDVGAKISETFGGNCSKTTRSDMKNVSFLGTLNRVLEIQGNGLDKTFKSHSDLHIQPDASKYPFDDFTYGKELYEIGYTAAMKVMPELKKSYQSLIDQ